MVTLKGPPPLLVWRWVSTEQRAATYAGKSTVNDRIAFAVRISHFAEHPLKLAEHWLRVNQFARRSEYSEPRLERDENVIVV